MIEVVASTALAALAGGSFVLGLGAAGRSRPRVPVASRAGAARLLRHRSLIWPAGPALLGLLVPVTPIVTVPVGVVVGLCARGVRDARLAARRRAAADHEVPQLLDLLAAASSAGASALAGFRSAVATLRGPLGQELRGSLDAVDLGAGWRAELARVTERLDLPDLRRVSTILDRTATLGVSLSDATRELAGDVRQARRAAVAERARSAPVKMLFPLVFLILPAFLLLTVVPVLLTTVRSIR
jgi:tight adherence protein C